MGVVYGLAVACIKDVESDGGTFAGRVCPSKS